MKREKRKKGVEGVWGRGRKRVRKKGGKGYGGEEGRALGRKGRRGRKWRFKKIGSKCGRNRKKRRIKKLNERRKKEERRSRRERKPAAKGGLLGSLRACSARDPLLPASSIRHPSPFTPRRYERKRRRIDEGRRGMEECQREWSWWSRLADDCTAVIEIALAYISVNEDSYSAVMIMLMVQKQWLQWWWLLWW